MTRDRDIEFVKIRRNIKNGDENVGIPSAFRTAFQNDRILACSIVNGNLVYRPLNNMSDADEYRKGI